MTSSDKKQAFAEKYGLEGYPVHISLGTKEYVEILLKKNDIVLADGEYVAKHSEVKYKKS